MINSQTKVGLLLMAAIIIMAGVVMNLGKVRLEKGYEFYVMFDNLADLPARSVVKIAGVEVGWVSSVDLYEGRARVKLWVKDKIKIRRDTNIKILKMGLVGNTFISLTLGTDDYPIVGDGDVIDGLNPLNYEEVIDGFMAGLNEVVDMLKSVGKRKDIGDDLAETFANLRSISGSLNNALGKDGRKISKTVDNLNLVINNLNVVLENQISAITDSMDKLGGAAEEMKLILTKIRQGEGTAGALLTNEEYGKKIGDTIDSIYNASVDLKQAVNRVKGFDTSLGAEVYYEPGEEVYRSYSEMTLRSSSKRYLSVGIENIEGLEEDPDNRDISGDRVNAFSLMAGKTFGNFTVFGGAIRSTGGFGADWIWRNRLNIGTKLFDFTGNKPWWTLSSKLNLVEFIDLGLAYENILDEGSFRAGVEVKIK